jgi:hypothetical protein
LTFDAENRLVSAPYVQYAYDSQNKRVWVGAMDYTSNPMGQAVNLYGVPRDVEVGSKAPPRVIESAVRRLVLDSSLSITPSHQAVERLRRTTAL